MVGRCLQNDQRHTDDVNPHIDGVGVVSAIKGELFFEAEWISGGRHLLQFPC